jgi:hypothetical protein
MPLELTTDKVNAAVKKVMESVVAKKIAASTPEIDPFSFEAILDVLRENPPPLNLESIFDSVLGLIIDKILPLL